MGWFHDWRLRRAVKFLKDAQKRSVDIDPVLIRNDGFMPDAVFVGGSLEQNLQASVWCFAALTANAEMVASLPAVVQRREGDKWVASEEDHALKRFIRRPLGPAGPAWSWQQLMEMLALQVELCGNAYLYPMNLSLADQLAVQIVRHPHGVTADEDVRTGYPVTYHTDTFRIPASGLCNIQNANPSSFWKGVSVFEAARRDVAIDRNAHDRVMYNLRNRIGSHLVIKQGDFFGLSDEEKAKILKLVKAEYQATSKDGMPMVVGKEVEFDKIPAQDPGTFIFDTRRLSREGIMAAAKVPPPILGCYENATLQNFSQARLIWWTVKLFPFAEMVFGAINAQIIAPRFGDGIRLWYDPTNTPIGVEVVKSKAQAAQALVELGFPTNVAAAHVNLGLPPHPALDEPNTALKKAGREQPSEMKEPGES